MAPPAGELSAAERAVRLIDAFEAAGAVPALADAVAADLVRTISKAEKRPPGASVAAQVKWCRVVLAPLAIEVVDIIGAFADWEATDQAEFFYQLHLLAGHPARVCPALSQDVTAYGRLVASLVQSVGVTPSRSDPRRWWTRPLTIAAVGMLAGSTLLCVVGTPLLSEAVGADEWTSRSRVLVSFAGAAAFLGGLAYGRWGWHGCRRRHPAPDDESDGDAVLFGSAVGAPPPAAAAQPSTDDVIAELRRENAALRASGSSRPAGAPVPPGGFSPAPAEATTAGGAGVGLEALGHFAAGTAPGGPISATAAGQRGLPPAGVSGVPYAPAAQESADEVRRQAEQVASIYEYWYSKRSVDPGWGSAFWTAIDTMPVALGPTLSGVLDEFGRGTRDAPSALLGPAVWRLMTASPAVFPAEREAGLAAAQRSVAPGLLRYDTRLDPDLRRAASAVYIKLRSQGATSCRDFLSTYYGDAKGDHRWIDLWQSACTVDFALADCETNEEVMARLQQDDLLEIHLRRLGSWVYERRTKDRVGAQNMLAIAAPGMSLDISPAWLVAESTGFSREEHNRDVRVQAARGSGRGRAGDGRGSGAGRQASSRGGRTDGAGGGRGAASGSANPQDAAAAPGRGGGRARGRGRGRGSQ